MMPRRPPRAFAPAWLAVLPPVLLSMLLSALLSVPLSVLLPAPCAAATAPFPTRSWPRATPREQGIDPEALLALTAAIARPGNAVDAVLVVRHGYLVSEAYFAPYAGAQPHDLRSVTKSVTGTLAGIAIEQGRLQPGQPVMPFFPAYRSGDPRQERLTVEHLLDMRGAIAWKEWPYDAASDVMRMARSPDWVRFILSRPMRSEPGQAFHYCGALPHLLSAVLARAAGGDTARFAEGSLFRPLGIGAFSWNRDPQGIAIGESGLALAPRDLAKLGLLYLRDGTWDGRRLLPAWWTARLFNASRPHGMAGTGALPPNYAALWWVDPAVPMAVASGRHGQHLVLLPRQDIVVVVNAKAPDGVAAALDVPALVRRVLLPGVDAAPPRRDRAGEQRGFEQRLRALTAEVPLAGIGTPPTAARIAGLTYRLDANPIGLATLAVRPGPAPAALLHTHWRTAAAAFDLKLPFRTDGRHAMSGKTPLGIYATRGAWIDPASLLVEMALPGNSVATRMLLRFEDGGVRVTVTDGDGLRVVIKGRVA